MKKIEREDLDRHKFEDHDGEPTWPEYDAQGIYLTRVCDRCERASLAGYRPEILSGYTQADVDEPIEPEPDSFEGGLV
jgi:hypothetical protein